MTQHEESSKLKPVGTMTLTPLKSKPTASPTIQEAISPTSAGNNSPANMQTNEDLNVFKFENKPAIKPKIIQAIDGYRLSKVTNLAPVRPSVFKQVLSNPAQVEFKFDLMAELNK